MHKSACKISIRRFDYNSQVTGISSISSAQEPRSGFVSRVFAGQKETKACHTLILQEGPNGHLLAFLLLRRYKEALVIIPLEFFHSL